MEIYSIPPLISLVILFILFLMGIFKAKKARVNLLFSLICLVGCLLNLDKTLLTIIQDPALAIKISRINHIFLVFIIPLYLHFIVLITGDRPWVSLVKIFYIISILLIPLTQNSQYLTHAERFFFGYFAQAGPFFYIFGTISTVSTVISIYLLIKNLKMEQSAQKRTRIKYILLSFGLAASVNHFDVFVMRGFEFYPLGNFVFIPMCLFAYSIYKHDIMEWRIFLNKGLIFFLLLVMSAGFFIVVATLMKRFFLHSIGIDLIYIISMILTFLFVYFTRERVQTFIIEFMEQESIKSRQAIRELSFEIMELLNVEEIKKIVIDRITKTFSLNKCILKMVSNMEENSSPSIIHEDDPMYKNGYRLLVPVRSRAHPCVILLGEKGNMTMYTGEDVEILSMLANHVALALDNAQAYKKIEDFSKSLERLVEERTKALIQSESLAAVGRLAAGVAHELNNPIASVMSTIEYYIDHTKEDDAIHDDLAFSLKELKRARDIVKSLLDASRQKEETKILTDIHNPLEDALRILYNQYKNKRITIEKRLKGENSIIMGNPARLCQVFINLIKNSMDAIGDNEGMIIIETSNPDDSHIRCIISDTGEGMDESVLKDIFKPFFTTKKQGQGIGLGLYIVHEIVNEHEGSIEVDSAKGKGTTFTLVFPSRRQ
ncbi:MAG TPA: ATP-binding protein [Syntrophorhabdaceae bacterium]|nr:ATP-binding protein [Syntrophorhabdaceae bacterium]